jgi:hypothetical protein
MAPSPAPDTGDLLVRRGRIGHVRDVGTFLQDQIIYSVHFLDEGRVVGCREEELIGVDEPWIESRFEVRQKVVRRARWSYAASSGCRWAAAAKSSTSNDPRRRACSITCTSTACQGIPCWSPRRR